jgi:hypothetical protein
LEWGFTTAASVLLALGGLTLYLLRRIREQPRQPRQRRQLPRSDPEPAVSLLFVAGHSGYRLLQIEPRALSAGARLNLDGVLHNVARVGPAPLPADPRRCAFVEPSWDP